MRWPLGSLIRLGLRSAMEAARLIKSKNLHSLVEFGSTTPSTCSYAQRWGETRESPQLRSTTQ